MHKLTNEPSFSDLTQQLTDCNASLAIAARPPMLGTPAVAIVLIDGLEPWDEIQAVLEELKRADYTRLVMDLDAPVSKFLDRIAFGEMTHASAIIGTAMVTLTEDTMDSEPREIWGVGFVGKELCNRILDIYRPLSEEGAPSY